MSFRTGLDNVAAVIAELAESVDAGKLVAAARKSPVVWAQRLGYLLDLTEHQALAEALLPLVKQHAHSARLARSRRGSGAARSRRWKLSANVAVEAEL